MNTLEMQKACLRAAELMRWFDRMDPPIGHKEAVEVMLVGIAISLKAVDPDNKKWLKKGAKLMGQMIGDVLDMLEYVETARKEKM